LNSGVSRRIREHRVILRCGAGAILASYTALEQAQSDILLATEGEIRANQVPVLGIRISKNLRRNFAGKFIYLQSGAA
jgi:hypothetical protein